MHRINTINYKDIKGDLEKDIVKKKSKAKVARLTTSVNGNHYAFVINKNDIALLVNGTLYRPGSDTSMLPKEAKLTLKALSHIVNKESYEYVTTGLLVPGIAKENSSNPYLKFFEFEGSDIQILIDRDERIVYGYFYNNGQSPAVPTYSAEGSLVGHKINNNMKLDQGHLHMLSVLNNKLIYPDISKQASFESTVKAFYRMIKEGI